MYVTVSRLWLALVYFFIALVMSDMVARSENVFFTLISTVLWAWWAILAGWHAGQFTWAAVEWYRERARK